MTLGWVVDGEKSPHWAAEGIDTPRPSAILSTTRSLLAFENALYWTNGHKNVVDSSLNVLPYEPTPYLQPTSYLHPTPYPHPTSYHILQYPTTSYNILQLTLQIHHQTAVLFCTLLPFAVLVALQQQLLLNPSLVQRLCATMQTSDGPVLNPSLVQRLCATMQTSDGPVVSNDNCRR
jgi:hypothetical protein